MQSLIEDMKQQSALKDQKIKQYADELHESEQMRQMVLNLMNNKKLKK